MSSLGVVVVVVVVATRGCVKIVLRCLLGSVLCILNSSLNWFYKSGSENDFVSKNRGLERGLPNEVENRL